jgi:hypothetical protein
MKDDSFDLLCEDSSLMQNGHVGNGETDENEGKPDGTAAGVGEEKEVVIPSIIKKGTGLMKVVGGRGNQSSLSSSYSLQGLYGFNGIAQELQRFLNIIADSLKKKVPKDGFNREVKKYYETKIRNAFNDSLEETKACVLELEECIHSIQKLPDKKEDEEAEAENRKEREEMLSEGWIFLPESETAAANINSREKGGKKGGGSSFPVNVTGGVEGFEYVGKTVRRYFPKFGISDGIIIAILPGEKNDGITLYRLIHNDGDREDLELNDLLVSLRYFENNMNKAEIKAAIAEEKETAKIPSVAQNETADGVTDEGARKKKGQKGKKPTKKPTKLEDNDGVSSETEDDEEEGDSDDELLVDDDNDEEASFDSSNNLHRSSSLSKKRETASCSEGLLWPTYEIRQRWKDSVSSSHTIGELACSLSILEEYSYYFGLFGEFDSILPLSLFLPPLDPAIAKALKESASSRYPHRDRNALLKSQQYEALSPRKAKKRAISEISRFQKKPVSYEKDEEESDSSSEGDERTRRRVKRQSGGKDEQSSEEEEEEVEVDEENEDESEEEEVGNTVRRSSRIQSVTVTTQQNQRQLNRRQKEHSNCDDGAEFYNSGRPSRSAAQKITSYAV